ncbi:MAG: hypothetical protein ACI4QS_05045 [Comamonas sp.]
MSMEDKFFLQDGMRVAPQEWQAWKDSQKRAFDLASDALVQKALAKEAQASADTQAVRALDAQEMADEACEQERRYKEAFEDAVNRQRTNSSQ